MKGSIIKCLQELVISKAGKEVWQQSLEAAGVNKATIFLPVADIDDQVALSIVQAVCETMGISLQEAADAFGDYWVNVYSQQIYPSFYLSHKNARDFLLAMDNLHIKVTNSVSNARPPRFQYEQTEDGSLIMHYQSHRGMIDFLVGLIKGVGTYYKQPLDVVKLDAQRVQISFL